MHRPARGEIGIQHAIAPSRIVARPEVAAEVGPEGLSELPLEGERTSFAYVPAGRPGSATPLLVFLHGAGGNPHQSLRLLREAADAQGVMLLVPASSGFTWDIVLGDYGPDIVRIDHALRHVFERYSIDRERLGIAGFSDGASYALSVGLANGDLFTHIMAFSPGFAAPGERIAYPRIFVSHGTSDPVLPIAPCSRRIVGQLRDSGLDVEYLEFDGGHLVPGPVARAALRWFLPSAAA
jgi:phospholipase/carboxylesterase